MRLRTLIRTTAPLLLIVSSATAGAAETPLKTPKDMMNYSIGVEVVRNYKKQGMEGSLDLEMMVRGMKDALAGERLLLTEKEIRKSMNSVLAEVRQRTAKNSKIAADVNRKKGEEFMEANRKKEGVVTLPSGVQYKVLKEGNGQKPVETDSVECHYFGTLLNGTEFDGTDPDKPAILKVSQLIPGWRDAMKLMPVGSRWQIVIPSALAYGTKGVGRDIGPNETLVFEVELLGIRQ